MALSLQIWSCERNSGVLCDSGTHPRELYTTSKPYAGWVLLCGFWRTRAGLARTKRQRTNFRSPNGVSRASDLVRVGLANAAIVLRHGYVGPLRRILQPCSFSLYLTRFPTPFWYHIIVTTLRSSNTLLKLM
jgi:hypothetical protein